MLFGLLSNCSDTFKIGARGVYEGISLFENDGNRE